MCGFLSRIRVSHYYFFPLTCISNPSLLIQPSQCAAFMWNADGTFFFFSPRSPEDPSHSLFPAQTLGAANYRANWRVFPRSPDNPSHSFFNKIKMDGRRGGEVLRAGGVKRSLSCSLALTCCLWADLRVSHVFPDDSRFRAHMIITCTVQWQIVMTCHNDV